MVAARFYEVLSMSLESSNFQIKEETSKLSFVATPADIEATRYSSEHMQAANHHLHLKGILPHFHIHFGKHKDHDHEPRVGGGGGGPTDHKEPTRTEPADTRQPREGRQPADRQHPDDRQTTPEPKKVEVPEGYKSPIKQDVQAGPYQVQEGDSLWKIAKNHLPKDASNQEIMEYMKEIAAANKMKDLGSVIKQGDTLNLPGHNKNGDHILVDKDGNKTTTSPDGTVKQENKDGTGFLKKPDGSEHHWGPKAEDNFEVTKDGGKQTKDKDGNTITTWKDGTEKHESADGKSGYVKKADGSEHHWGPDAKDNYDLTKDGTKVTKDQNGTIVEEHKDGSKTTKWADGTVKQENKDGTGFVKKPDGSEHHWGPKAEDNFEVTKDGGKQTKDKDGNTTTVWKDGTEKHESKDGKTGYVKSPDGSEHHWGPKGKDNYDITKDGTKVTKDSNGVIHGEHKDGSKTTQWPDGTIKHESKDGKTGWVRKPDHSEHHWGPHADDNYDVTKDGGIKKTDGKGNSTTMWPNGVMKYENGDGSGAVWTPQPDGTYKVHHWGKHKDDNYDTTVRKPAA